MMGAVIYGLSILFALVFAIAIIKQQYFLFIVTGILLGALVFIQRRLLGDSDEDLREFEVMKGIQKPMGEIAIDCGMLNKCDLLKILKVQSKIKIPFGKVAVKLKLLDKKQITTLLGVQQRNALIL